MSTAFHKYRITHPVFGTLCQSLSSIGGHATVAVGYDDRITSQNPRPFIWVRNSWGPNWDLQGYFKMDQAWFSDPRRLVDDMWIIIPK